MPVSSILEVSSEGSQLNADSIGKLAHLATNLNKHFPALYGGSFKKQPNGQWSCPILLRNKA